MIKFNNLKEKLLLISATLVWGGSYPLSKMAFHYMGSLTMVSLRFLIGFIIVALFFNKNLKSISKTTFKNGFLLGVFLFLGIIFSTYGVEYTSASNAGFLSCLYIIIVPFISFFVYKKKLLKKEIIGSIITFIGVPLLTLTENFSIHFGDFLCLIGSFTFAIMIILGDIYAKKENPITLGVIQLGVVGLLSTIFAIVFENFSLNLDLKGYIVILSLALLCTAYCYTMQLYTQKYLSAVESSLILAFEPFFAVIFSFLFLGEILSFRASIGAILIMIGIIFGGVL